MAVSADQAHTVLLADERRTRHRNAACRNVTPLINPRNHANDTTTSPSATMGTTAPF
jgi:hypothetical protein